MTVDEYLQSCLVGCGWADFPVEGGVLRILAKDLRPALEEAYDPNMEAWPTLVELPDTEDDEID